MIQIYHLPEGQLRISAMNKEEDAQMAGLFGEKLAVGSLMSSFRLLSSQWYSFLSDSSQKKNQCTDRPPRKPWHQRTCFLWFFPSAIVIATAVFASETVVLDENFRKCANEVLLEFNVVLWHPDKFFRRSQEVNSEKRKQIKNTTCKNIEFKSS